MSAIAVRSISAGGGGALKFSPTIRSVPPEIGTTSGRSALAASASDHVVGWRKSIAGQYTNPRAWAIRLPPRTRRAAVPLRLEEPPNQKGTPVRLSVLVEAADGGLQPVLPVAH